MKNSEWGAVAYLTQSKYGRNGVEVTVNNSSSYITGNAGNTIREGQANVDIVNAYNTEKGVLASTTGTIYGIYDMVGGSSDIVMGNWANINKSDGFTIFPESKYYDLYQGTSQGLMPIEKSILGDATYETRKWYSDNTYVVDDSSPWGCRGGDIYYSVAHGVFDWLSGTNDHSFSFHTVLIP